MASQVERMTVIRCAVNASILYRIAFGELGVFPDEFSCFLAASGRIAGIDDEVRVLFEEVGEVIEFLNARDAFFGIWPNIDVLYCKSVCEQLRECTALRDPEDVAFMANGTADRQKNCGLLSLSNGFAHIVECCQPLRSFTNNAFGLFFLAEKFAGTAQNQFC